MKPRCVGAASSDDGPEFFKVFLPSFSSCKLGIPPAFLNNFKGKLPSKTILKDQTGKSWPVDLEEIDEECFFMNGWQAFMDDHLLEFGDFLIFRYLKSSIFNVKIFGKNGCIKTFTETANDFLPHVTITEEPDVCQIETRLRLGHFAPIATIKDEFDFDQTESHDTGSSSQKVSEVGPRGRRKNRAAKFNRCPSKFKVTQYDSSKLLIHEFVVTKWSLYKVHIPKSLIDECNINMGRQLVLEDQRGKQWPVKFVHKGGRITLTKGWSECRVRNNIKVDDKCVLELVLNSRNVCRKMNVKIMVNR